MHIDEFVLYRADRPSRGGGVATYVSSKYNSQRVTPNIEPVNFECLFININLNINKKMIIGNIYRPPSAPADSMKNILSTIDSLERHNELIILGDFNSNWLDRSSSNDRNLVKSVNLTQIINEPTRVGQYSSSLLDWILVTNPERITKSGVLSDCLSDHSIIFCVWKIKVPTSSPRYIEVKQCKNLITDDFIHDIIAINWDRFQLIPFAEDAWDFFSSEFNEVIDKHAPTKIIRVKGRHLPWINSNLLSLFKQRDKAWAKYRLSKDPSDWEIYRHLRNQCKTKTRNAKSDHYRDSLSQDFHNPRQFWKQLNRVLNRDNKNVTNQIQSNNEYISDPLLIANVFNQHFSNVCASQQFPPYNTANHSSHPNSLIYNNLFSFNKIQPTDVFLALSALKENSSTGPDGLEAKFFKLAAHVIMYPLADLFNLSLSTCSIPSTWKSARVTPLFKSGDPSDVNNYRPISIICVIAKVFEKLIFNQLSAYVNQSNILSPFQSGFRSNFSTTTALLKFTNDIFSSFDKGQLTGAIFIDLSKAFDMVDHYLLLDKLFSIGLSHQAVLWFNAYLHNRRQYVSFYGSQSDYLVVDKGVPQGSTLGPLLFSIFINDLPHLCTNCSVHLYADDTVIYTANSNISQIQHSLQLDFNSVQQWLHNNRLLLNQKKSCSMVFGTRHTHPYHLNLPILFADGSPLHKVDSFKYLGLWIDPELSFKPHIDFIIKRTYGCLSSLYRSINCFTLPIRKRIISQLILPIIDYADIIYQNTSVTNLRPLNVVFNSLSRFVLRCPFRTHHCHLYELLNWLQPKSRRYFHWVLFIFKCIYFNCPSYLKSLLIPFRSSYSLRNMQYPFYFVPNISKEIGRNAFGFKAPSDWNNLPLSLRSISSYHCFKSSLFCHLKTNCSCF